MSKSGMTACQLWADAGGPFQQARERYTADSQAFGRIRDAYLAQGFLEHFPGVATVVHLTHVASPSDSQKLSFIDGRPSSAEWVQAPQLT